MLRWNHLSSVTSFFCRFLMEIGVLLLLDDNGTSLSLNDIYAKLVEAIGSYLRFIGT